MSQPSIHTYRYVYIRTNNNSKTQRNYKMSSSLSRSPCNPSNHHDEQNYNVSIKAKFSLPDGECVEQVYDERNEHCRKPARIGLASDVPLSKPENGDYSYSGMHDHGPLYPPPKEGGVFAMMIRFVDEARKGSNNYLTQIIEKEKLQRLQNKNNATDNDSNENDGTDQSVLKKKRKAITTTK